MKTPNLLLIGLGFLFLSHTNSNKNETEKIDELVDAWHLAAASSNFEAYFDFMDERFVFLGTDPTERWDKTTFASFTKPYFEQGKGWNFTKIERFITVSSDGKTAWFDERINTWMRDCRGNGVLVKSGKTWKIAQYNLAVLIENDKIRSFIALRDSVMK